jgi:hypothetical protein
MVYILLKAYSSEVGVWIINWHVAERITSRDFVSCDFQIFNLFQVLYLYIASFLLTILFVLPSLFYFYLLLLFLLNTWIPHDFLISILNCLLICQCLATDRYGVYRSQLSSNFIYSPFAHKSHLICFKHIFKLKMLNFVLVSSTLLFFYNISADFTLYFLLSPVIIDVTPQQSYGRARYIVYKNNVV